MVYPIHGWVATYSKSEKYVGPTTKPHAKNICVGHHMVQSANTNMMRGLSTHKHRLTDQQTGDIRYESHIRPDLDELEKEMKCTFRVSMVYVGWRSIRGLMVLPEVRPRREFSLAVAVCGRSGAWLKIRRRCSNVLWLLWEQIGCSAIDVLRWLFCDGCFSLYCVIIEVKRPVCVFLEAPTDDLSS